MHCMDQAYTYLEFVLLIRSVNFEMSFWCHRFDQNSNENIVRISALKVFIASLGFPGSFLGLPVGFLINDITY